MDPRLKLASLLSSMVTSWLSPTVAALLPAAVGVTKWGVPKALNVWWFIRNYSINRIVGFSPYGTGLLVGCIFTDIEPLRGNFLNLMTLAVVMKVVL
jgi:hypothetical protein